MPELLDQLALADDRAALDAVGRQTATTKKTLARGGDCLLTLKGPPLAHAASPKREAAAVVGHFDRRRFRRGASHRADCDAFGDTFSGAPLGSTCEDDSRRRDRAFLRKIAPGRQRAAWTDAHMPQPLIGWTKNLTQDRQGSMRRS